MVYWAFRCWENYFSKRFVKNYKKKKYKVLRVDGDLFRKKKKNCNNFSKKNIYHNNLQIIKYIKSVINKYDFIIVSVISPLKRSRLFAYKTFKKKYFEVFVKCSLKELIRRDTKKLYQLAIKKKINNLIGFNSKINYEKSNYKKVLVETDKMNKKLSIKKIKEYLNKTYYVKI